MFTILVEKFSTTILYRRKHLWNFESPTIFMGEMVISVGKGSIRELLETRFAGNIFFIVVSIFCRDGFLELAAVGSADPPEIVPYPSFTTERIPNLVNEGMVMENSHYFFPWPNYRVYQLCSHGITCIVFGEFFMGDSLGMKIQEVSGSGTMRQGPYPVNTKIFMIVFLVHGEGGTGTDLLVAHGLVDIPLYNMVGIGSTAFYP